MTRPMCTHFSSFRHVHKQPPTPKFEISWLLYPLLHSSPPAASATWCTLMPDLQNFSNLPNVPSILKLNYISCLKCSSKMPIMLEGSMSLLVGLNGGLFFFQCPATTACWVPIKHYMHQEGRISKNTIPKQALAFSSATAPGKLPVTAAISATSQKCHGPLCLQGQRTHRFTRAKNSQVATIH